MRKKVSVTCFAVLSALCIIFLLPVCVMAAETGDKKEGAYTYRYNEEYAGIEIVKYDVNKQKSRVQVPDRIDNIPVTVIGEKAFMEEDEIIAKRRKNRSIQEVVLPETVVALKAHAFDGCTRLKKIQYSGNLKILEEGVFNDCRKLENFSLPEELKEIPASLFRYCYNLKEISIPKSVVVIGDYAFDCTEIKEAELEDLELKRIGDYAFARCNLTKITLPDSLEEIGAGAFENCRKLKKVKFGANSQLKVLGDDAFLRCKKLSNITIPEGVQKIGMSAFMHCVSLKKIKIPQMLQEIGHSVFLGCRKLEEFTIPAGWTSIPAGMFGSCKNLKEITIPKGITRIQGSAFNESGLQKIRFEKGSGLKEIDYRAFYRCKLASVTLPDSLEFIGREAFHECLQLKNVMFGGNSQLKEIDRYAFFKCRKIKEFTIPERVAKIGLKAFSHCNSLKKIVFQGKPPVIKGKAFADVNKNATFKVPGEYKNAYQKILKKMNGYQKTMRIRS